MKQVLTITYYETIHILRDRLLLLLIFVVPFLYTLVFGLVYVAGILTNIPVGIVNLDQSQLSREVVTAYANSPYFKIIDQIKTYPQLEKAMRDGTVRAGIVIPENFAAQTTRHSKTEILTVYDSSNLIWGYNTRKYNQEIINRFNINHTAAYLAGMGLTQQEINSIMDTVACRYEVWYNPTYSYATFLFMGLVLMILHQIGLLSISLTVTREKEKNCWVQYLCSAVPRWKIFLGKAIPYYAGTFFNYGLLLWFSAQFIRVKIEGSLALIILLGLIYILVITAAGFCISVRATNSLQVTRYIMLLSIPFFMISGYTWPSTHIPDAINGLARLLPFTWAAEGFRLVTLKGLGFSYISTHILVLSIMAGLAVYLALNFDKRRKPPQKNGLSVNSESITD